MSCKQVASGAADRVGDALLGEARLGGAGQLLLLGLGVARRLGILLALRQEAFWGGAGELLLVGLRLAGGGRALRHGAGREQRENDDRDDPFHGGLVLVWAAALPGNGAESSVRS